jgi:hypothetical protein
MDNVISQVLPPLHKDMDLYINPEIDIVNPPPPPSFGKTDSLKIIEPNVSVLIGHQTIELLDWKGNHLNKYERYIIKHKEFVHYCSFDKNSTYQDFIKLTALIYKTYYDLWDKFNEEDSSISTYDYRSIYPMYIHYDESTF